MQLPSNTNGDTKEPKPILEGRVSRERTMGQVWMIPGPSPMASHQLPHHRESSVRSYIKFREMRKDPTIALVRTLVTAPIVKSGWSYEKTDKAPSEALDIIKATLDPLRIDLIKSSLEGCIDFGWQGYEKIRDVDHRGFNTFRAIKPLLQDRTEIMVDRYSGRYIGLRQLGPYGYVDLDAKDSLHVAVNVEGTDWYGRADMVAAEGPYDRWNLVEQSAARYDEKIAGAHWVVTYPVGETMYLGAMTDNFEIAKSLIQTMRSSGAVTIPAQMAKYVDDLNAAQFQNLWKVELLADPGKGSMDFTMREKYLDALKVRAFGVSERAILEGQFGTKAEAQTHGDAAVINMELRYEMIVQRYNRALVDDLLEMNWGPSAKGSVYLDATPLDDATKGYLQQIYAALLNHPEAGLVEADYVDLDNLRDRLGIPSREPPMAQVAAPVSPSILEPADLAKIGMEPEMVAQATLQHRQRMPAQIPPGDAGAAGRVQAGPSGQPPEPYAGTLSQRGDPNSPLRVLTKLPNLRSSSGR